MKSTRVLLERGFLAAVVDDDDRCHESAATIYASLLDEYQAGRVRLHALSSDLAAFPRDVRRQALAPVDTMWVARQHRSAASRVEAPSLEIALTLTMATREHCSTIATTDPYYARFDVDVLVATPADDGPIGPDAEQIPDGYVSYETEPLPARQSTDG